MGGAGPLQGRRRRRRGSPVGGAMAEPPSSQARRARTERRSRGSPYHSNKKKQVKIHPITTGNERTDIGMND